MLSIPVHGPIAARPFPCYKWQIMSSKDWSFYEYLKLDGDGTNQVTGNHLAAAAEYSASAPAGNADVDLLIIQRLVVYIQDATAFRASWYGGIGAGLTNGLGLSINDSEGNKLLDLTGGESIKTNGQWGGICFDTHLSEYGAGSESLAVRYTFEKSGSPVVLTNGETLCLEANDDFSGLEAHTFFLQGLYPYRAPTHERKLLLSRMSNPFS